MLLPVKFSLAIKSFLSRVLWVCGLVCTFQGLMAQGTFSRAGELTFIHPEANIVQYYNDTALTRLKQSWRAVKKTPFTVAHFGDEHVQADVFTGVVQQILQAEGGYGGWGMLQPTSIARTFSSAYYSSRHKGVWRYDAAHIMSPSLARGVSGMVAKTFDENAQISFDFHERISLDSMRLQIFCEAEKSFDLLWISGTDTVIIKPSTIDDDLPYTEVLIPPFDREFTLVCHKSEESQSQVILHGVNLLAMQEKGVVYHSLGVAGSGYAGMLNAELFSEQLAGLDPDLVILDFSMAELGDRDVLGPSTKQNIIRTLAKVKRACPNTTILLISAQDRYRKKKENIAVTQEYSNLLREIAKEKGCLIYDWFWASGGRARMAQWRMRNYAQHDLTSLTIKGYRLKAEMFGEALLHALTTPSASPAEVGVDVNALMEEQQQRLSDFSTLEPASSTTTQEVVSSNSNITASSPSKPASGGKQRKLTHTVVSGESLRKIAAKYEVEVSQMIAWNNLSDPSALSIGQKLTVYTNDYSTDDEGSILEEVTHTVKSGEVLSVIAEKYNVGLSQIIQWNSITDAASLAIGQELIIYPAQSNFLSGGHLSSRTQITHQVKSGEVLSLIAKKYNVGLSQLLEWNNIEDASRLQVGQDIVIYPNKTSVASDELVIHTVQSGEVLSVIAEKHNVGLSQLLEWNGLTTSSIIQVGQKLKVYPKQSNLE